MLSPKRPMDVAAACLAVALGAIAFMQWRASKGFARDAISVNATVVELRTAKRVLFDAEAEIFATVEFVPSPGTSDGPPHRAELSTPIQKLGLSPAGLEGTRVPIQFDPQNPDNVRYGQSDGHEGALVLALLAIGALFIPIVLRRSSLAAGGGT